MDANSAVDALYRSDWGRIVATLIRLVGDFDAVEEAAQEAFAAAVDQWRLSGVPDFPRAWVVETARHKAIDRIRRRTRFAGKLESLVRQGEAVEEPDNDTVDIPGDQLRLIFTCCHPALALDAQVALTLRTLGGLETEEIARAFLVPPVTMAQRLVRAKRKLRDAGIPYAVPGAEDLPERLDAVLTVIYPVFNEGYGALARTDLCAEAIRLGRLVRALMTPIPPAEAIALLALMLLHDSRRDARLDEAGGLDHYHLLHAARADLLRRAGSLEEAAKSYAWALDLVGNGSERRFLERRLGRFNPSRPHRTPPGGIRYAATKA